MAWRLHDYIHLNLTDIKLSDLKSCEEPLKLFDSMLDDNNHIGFITFSPQTQVIMDAFDEIVRKDNKYIAIIQFVSSRVFEFVCFPADKERSLEV